MTGFQVESSTPATCANAACVKSNPPNKWSMHYRDIDLQECITNCNVLNVGGNCDFLTYTRNVSYWNCFLIRSISGDGGKQAAGALLVHALWVCHVIDHLLELQEREIVWSLVLLNDEARFLP